MNNRIFSKFIQVFPFLFFALFTYLISYRLIGGIISTGDFPYSWPFSSDNSFSTWNTAYLGFSRASSMFGSLIFSFIPYFFSKIGFSNESISYFHNYGPVYLCSLFYFFITKNISKSTSLSYFAGLFIILNNFVLEHFLVLPGVIFYSLIIYGITLFICYNIYLQGLNLKKIILIIFLSFFHLHPFYFVINLMFLFIFSLYYSITHSKLYSRRQLYSYLIILFVGVIVIQSYWLIPFIKNVFISSSLQVYGKEGQSAVFSGYFQSISYTGLFSLYHYPGTLGEQMHGGVLQFILYFYLLSLLIFLLIKDQAKNSSWIIFLFFTLLIFFNLALGPISKLTGKIWIYFFEHLSVFGFFRSFSRFIILYLVIFIFLFVFLFKNWQSKHKNYVLLFTIFLLLTANIIFFSGDLGGFITSAKLPKEYVSLNKKYFQEDQLQYNILTLPNIPYESYNWFFANKKTKEGKTINQSTYFRELFFSKPVVYNRFAINLEKRNNYLKSFFKYNEDFMFFSNFNRSVDKLNVRYVLVQKDLINVLENNIQIPVKKYLNYFKKDNDFILKEDNEYFTLYENKDYFPIIPTSDIQFVKVNDTKYIVFIKNVTNNKLISFLQSYNEQWKLYLQSNSSDKTCKPVKYFKNTQTTECKSIDKKIDSKDLTFIFKKSIFDNTHKIVNEYANSWTLNSDYIKQNYSNEFYKENSDGTINISLTLYFKPQSYYYLGLIISISSLTTCLIYFIFTGIISLRKNKNV